MLYHISVYGTKLCASLYWYIMNVREKSKVNEKKRQKHEKNLKSNSLKSLCSHSLSHMCKNILKIILNKYGHLHPSLDLFSLLSSNPISSNPILLPLPNPLPPPAMLSLSSTQKDTCRFSHLLIHVVGLLLSLLWFHTHQTPWARLPQDYTQWYLGKQKPAWQSSMSERI